MPAHWRQLLCRKTQLRKDKHSSMFTGTTPFTKNQHHLLVQTKEISRSNRRKRKREKKARQTNRVDLDEDAEEPPVLLGEHLRDDAADGPAAGEGHADVVGGEEVRDLRGGPVEAIVDVVIAGGEDVQRQDEEEVATGDP